MNACARNRSAPRGRPIGAPSWSRGIDHNRCDRVAMFVVPVAAKIAKLADFEPMPRCAAKAGRALLERETMGPWRSETRHGGKECVLPVEPRGSPWPSKK